MSLHVISSKQLLSAVIAISIFLSASIIVTASFLNHQQQPEVYKDKDGKCVKVINYKNGDGYSCQDVNVMLRKYTVIHNE